MDIVWRRVFKGMDQMDGFLRNVIGGGSDSRLVEVCQAALYFSFHSFKFSIIASCEKGASGSHGNLTIGAKHAFGTNDISEESSISVGDRAMWILDKTLEIFLSAFNVCIDVGKVRT